MDIGLVGAHVLNDFDAYIGQALEITGSDFEGLHQAARLISENTTSPIKYVSPNLLRFYITKRKQGIAPAMIFVMIMLHFLPRLGKNKNRSTGTVKQITGRDPVRLEEFIKREMEKFQ
jgi:hypothetical protein